MTTHSGIFPTPLTMNGTVGDENNDNHNQTDKGLFEDIKWDVDFINLLASLLLSVIWITYLTYYNSRVFGFVITKILSRFVKPHILSFGSFSFSVLSGKLMLRECIFITEDYSVRVQDCVIIFRYWRPYVKRELGQDFSHASPRVMCYVHGLELHFYNHMCEYRQLCSLFGLDDIALASNVASPKSSGTPSNRQITAQQRHNYEWRDLIPVIKTFVSGGRVLFGNKMVPSTCVVSFDNGECVYTVKPPLNSADLYTHVLRGSCEDFKVSLVKSPGYEDGYEPPPRIMGEGFVVLQTAKLDFNHYYDQPGVVLKNSQDISGTLPNVTPSPCWGADIWLGKGTVISYGPWADKQRDAVYFLFYPKSYQVMPITQAPTAGERRICTQFDLKISTLEDSTVDILFTKNDVTNVMHLNFCAGSYFEMMFPLIVQENGYQTSISGQLMHAEASTSLAYRNLFESETFGFNCDMLYPRVWNSPQEWRMNFSGNKSTIWFVFAHKQFMVDLINEWSDPCPPDIFRFVPYIWTFTFNFEHLEVILVANQHNWVDSASSQQANVQLGVCASRLQLDFSLPMLDFLPDTIPLQFSFNAHNLEASIFLPEAYVTRQALALLFEHSTIKSHVTYGDYAVPLGGPRWRSVTKMDCGGWLPCWRAPGGGCVTISYTFHPNPTPFHSPLVDDLLISDVNRVNFDPTQLDPDIIEVKLELAASEIKLCGTLIKLVFALKENYFGECQDFTDFDNFSSQEVVRKNGLVTDDTFLPELFRPLHVVLSLKLRHITAHCLHFSTSDDVHCPQLFCEELAFEMDKRYTETRLQLALAPVVLHLIDSISRELGSNSTLGEGQLVLSALQLRGHAMFSNTGLAVDSITLEYAWLLELVLGSLSGRLTVPHVFQIVQFLDCFAFHLLNNEEDLQRPKSVEVCQHMIPRSLCEHSSEKELCQTEHDLKYKMLRVSLDCLNVHIVETCTSLQLSVDAVRLANCTLHSAMSKEGVSISVPSVRVKQFVMNEVLSQSPRGRETAVVSTKRPRVVWLETTSARLDEIKVNVSLPLGQIQLHQLQSDFLKLHDEKYRRLSFLWASHSRDDTAACGCIGGCMFFGSNSNGSRFFDGEVSKRRGLAMVTVNLDGDVGFGQSILRAGDTILSPTTIESPLATSIATFAKISQQAQPPLDVDIFYEAEEQLQRRSGESLADRSSTGSMSGSNSSLLSEDSFRSFSQRDSVSAVPFDADIDLYAQLNRPVFTSPMLMAGYSKYLNSYVCHNWYSVPSLPCFVGNKCRESVSEADSASSCVPSFELMHTGLNDITLVEDRNGHGCAGLETVGEEASTPDVSANRSAAVIMGNLQKLELAVKICDTAHIFLTPLGVEVIQRYIHAMEHLMTHTHLLSLIQELFDNCSSRHHRQTLVSGCSAATILPMPLQIHVHLPKIQAAVFQCGVVEKIVSFQSLGEIQALTPATVFLGVWRDITSHATTLLHDPLFPTSPAVNPESISASAATDDSTFSVDAIVGNIKLGHAYAQLIHVAGSTNAVIGISKSASRVPYSANWLDFKHAAVSVASVIMELGLNHAAIYVHRCFREPTAQPADKDKDDLSPSSPVDGPTNIGQKDTRNNSLSLVLGPLMLSFGLCLPSDESAAEALPLYDIVSPSVTAWLHVGHRISRIMVGLLKSRSEWRRRLISYVVTEAWHYPPCRQSPKSKYDVVRCHRLQLQRCPNCQLCLTLYRYCALSRDDVQSYERNVALTPRQAATDAWLPEALVAALSHWREVFARENTVDLTGVNEHVRKLAADLKLETVEQKTPRADQTTTFSVLRRAVGSELSDSLDDAEGELSSPLLCSTDDSVNDVVARMQSMSKRKYSVPHFTVASPSSITSERVLEEQLQQTSTPTKPRSQPPLPRAHSAARHTAQHVLRNANKSATLDTEDLYSWMAREQKSRRKGATAAQADQAAFVDPQYIPLTVFFEPIFSAFGLDTARLPEAVLAEYFGKLFVCSCVMDEVAVGIVEPRVLRYTSASGSKVSHTERPVVYLQELQINADVLYKRVEGLRSSASKKTVHNVTYHAHLARIECSIGFPSVSFINQMVFVGRTVRATAEDLLSCVPLQYNQPHGAREEDASPSAADGSWLRRAEDMRKYSQRLLSREPHKKIVEAWSLAHGSMGDPTVIRNVFGVVDVADVRVQVQMTQLYVTAVVSGVQFGHSDCERLNLYPEKKTVLRETSVTGAVQRANLVLSEDNPSMQVVVKMAIDPSQVLFTSALKKDGHKSKMSLLVEIGAVTVDVPLNPGLLHGVVLRGTKNISDTLRELQRTPQVVEDVLIAERLNEGSATLGHYSRQFDQTGTVAVVHFSVILRSLAVTAALLPSLKASYRMEQAMSSGVTGSEAKFLVDITTHRITFDVSGLADEVMATFVTPNIQLPIPRIMAQGAYIADGSSEAAAENARLAEDVVLREGGYLKVDVEVGVFQRELTTDLLNQLLFIEEAFTRELGEIVQKITSEKKPTPSLFARGAASSSHPLLYSLNVLLKNVQITATTPTSTAVRVEVDTVKFGVSNREVPVQRVAIASANKKQQASGSGLERVFGAAEINFALSLGQLVKDAMFEEVKADFQPFAYFKTRVRMSNAPSSVASDIEGSTAYLITVHRPMIFILPTAVDKAILLWLNYKNTYEFWNEQRQQIRAKSPPKPPQSGPKEKSMFEQYLSGSSAGFPSSNTPLFLQMRVEEGLYLCLPLHSAHYAGVKSVEDSSCALVLSLADTSIAVCSYGCLVSHGRFKKFQVTFVEDFDPAADDWRPDLERRVPSELNMCFVPDGTYKICSRTTAPSDEHHSAEWILNITWEMQGIDMNFNTRVGKLISLLASTLTSFAGAEDDRTNTVMSGKSTVPLQQATEDVDASIILADFPELKHSLFTAKVDVRQVERVMNEQAKLVNDLSQLGASENTIELERRKLQRLESVLFNNFRYEMRQKLRRQSQKATSIKDRLGIGYYKTPPHRSVSLARRPAELDAEFGSQTLSRHHSDLPRHSRKHYRAGSYDQSRLLQTSTILEADERTPSHDRLSVGYQTSTPSTPSEDHHASSSTVAAGLVRSTETIVSSNGSFNTVSPPEVTVESYGTPTGGPSSPSSEDEEVHWRSGRTPVFDREHSGTHTPLPPSAAPAAVDLYLDLKIFISSGQCKFRSVTAEDDRQNSSTAGKKATQFADRQRSGSKTRGKTSASKAKSVLFQSPASNETTIAIPGVNVKSYYASHGGAEGSLNPAILKTSLSEEVVQHMLSSNKKAQFCMSLTLESMPDETVVSPHILDFLEQTIDLLPRQGSSSSSWTKGTAALVASPRNTVDAGAVSPGADVENSGGITLDPVAPVTSFPVDVVVNLLVHSSTIRFTSFPYSRVECLLRLPTLSLVATSRKSSDLLVEPKQARIPLHAHQSRAAFPNAPPEELLTGGISVTGVLSDFSLYIFHPYGTTTSAARSAGGQAVTDRKDSLSLQVKSVILNISRCRNMITMESRDIGSLTGIFSDLTSAALKNSVRFSLLVDISSAIFRYDMRRLNEILSFPKAWYRRNIVRRLFLGDDSSLNPTGVRKVGPSNSVVSTAESVNSGDSIPPRKASRQQQSFSWSADDSEDGDVSSLDHSGSAPRTPAAPLRKSSVITSQTNKGGWEATVLFAVNFSELDVITNMANTMGNTKWRTTGATSQGHVAIDSDGNKSMQCSFGLGLSELDSKGGMVGGGVELKGVKLAVGMKQQSGGEPQHSAGAVVGSSQLKAEWMGTTVFMGCVSDLDMSVKDEWKLLALTAARERTRASVASGLHVDKGHVIFSGRVQWTALQIMISKNTVGDFMKMYNRMREFFEQEFKSGKRILLFAAAQNNSDESDMEEKKEASGKVQENDTTAATPPMKLKYHRHWQKALDLVTQLMYVLRIPIPADGVEVGGMLEFLGEEISLACFHGPNFRSQKWALFHLRKPSISFNSEAHDIVLHQNIATDVYQDLSFYLGEHTRQRRSAEPMALVLQVQRGHYIPPQLGGIQEWFHYTFTSVFREIYGVEPRDPRLRASAREYSHAVAKLLQLPAMHMHLKTRHVQEQQDDGVTTTKPVVECGFMADFDGHVEVSSDVEALYFLHELVRSYQSTTSMSARRNSMSNSVHKGGAKVKDPTEELSADGREFSCTSWRMEPTVRIIDMAHLEPYGVDYILQNLGFKHARTTIPKWTQRGFMDPLDALLAAAVELILHMPLRGKTKQSL